VDTAGLVDSEQGGDTEMQGMDNLDPGLQDVQKKTVGLRIALVWEYKNVVSRYHWISPIASPLLHPTQGLVDSEQGGDTEMQGMDNLDPGLQDVQKKIAKVLEGHQS
jgi:hypothetical protein